MAADTSSGAGSVTIQAGTTTTKVEHYGVSDTSAVHLMPKNAISASQDALGWHIAPTKDSFTITHSNMSVARAYAYLYVTPKG